VSLLNSGGRLPPSKADLSLKKGKNSRLLARFKGFVRKERLFGPNSSILVAVSGGPDSVCLLHLLFILSRKWPLKLAAAHFDHRLRGAESQRDMNFVRMLCKENAISFYTSEADIKAEAKRMKKGIQETARRFRYAFLKDVAQREGFNLIATGHTCDDQAEEVLFRLLRGAGPSGLSGIRLKRNDGVIRPLLFCRKAEILEHLKKYGIPYVTDSSNKSLKYTRNRIRTLIPLIEKDINPSAVHAVYRASRLLAEENRAILEMAERSYDDCLMPELNFRVKGTGLSRKKLASLPRAVRKRILQRAMIETGVDADQIKFDHLEKCDEIAVSSQPSAFYSLPGGFVLAMVHNSLLFLHEIALKQVISRQDGNDSCVVAERPGRFVLPWGGEIRLEETSRFSKAKQKSGCFPRSLYISLKKTDFPFYVTQRKNGDRFKPYGWSESTRLKKFLINRSIPRIIRDCLPVIRKDHRIVAVGGVEISQDATVSSEHERCLLIEWTPEELTGLFASFKASS